MVRWLHGIAVTQQLAIGHVKDAFDEDGNLIDEDSDRRLQTLVESVLTTAELYRNTQ
jgi:FMN reductase